MIKKIITIFIVIMSLSNSYACVIKQNPDSISIVDKTEYKVINDISAISKIEIYDQNGNLVFQTEKISKTIEIACLRPGFYTVKLLKNGKIEKIEFFEKTEKF